MKGSQLTICWYRNTWETEIKKKSHFKKFVGAKRNSCKNTDWYKIPQDKLFEDGLHIPKLLHISEFLP